MQTTIYKINKLQKYIVQHREILSLFYNNFKWSIVYKKLNHCHSLETNIILQINYNLIKKKKTNVPEEYLQTRICCFQELQ